MKQFLQWKKVCFSASRLLIFAILLSNYSFGQLKSDTSSKQLRTESLIGDLFGGLDPCNRSLLDPNGSGFICFGSSAEYGIQFETFKNIEWRISFGYITAVNGRDINSWVRNVIPDAIDYSYNYTDIYIISYNHDNREIRIFYGSGNTVVARVANSYDPFFLQNVAKPKNISITPAYNQNGGIGISVDATGLANGFCIKSDGRYVPTFATPDAYNTNFSSTGTPSCYAGVQYEVSSYNYGVSYSFSAQDATINSNWGHGASINNFTSPGPKTISITGSNGCGSYTTSKTINIAQPPVLYYSTSGQLIFKDYKPTMGCDEAANGFAITIKEGTKDFNDNKATYGWSIPTLWKIDGKTAFTNNNKNIYFGPDLKTVYVRQAGNPGGIKGGDFIAVVHTCNTDVPVYPAEKFLGGGINQPSLFQIKEKPFYYLSVPGDVYCDNNLTLTPNIQGPATNVRVNWESQSGYFPNGTQTTIKAGDPGSNVFHANNSGFQSIRITGIDDRNCPSTPLPAYLPSNWQYNDIRVGSSSFSSGWNSGVLPRIPQPSTVSGNSIAVNIYNEVFFIGSNGKGYYYSFDNRSSQWVLNSLPNLTNGKTTGNSIAIGPYNAPQYLYYIDNAGNISYVDIYNTNLPPVKVINSNNAIGSLNVDKVTGNLFFRGTGNKIYKFTPGDAQASEFISTATVYGIEINNSRVFYVEQVNGSQTLKYKGYDNTTGTIDNNIYCYTDIRFNRLGDVIYSKCGNIFTSVKNGSSFNNPLQLPLGRAGTNGHFTVNQSTGTIYYASYDNGAIIEIYNKNGGYNVIYATDNVNPGDQAETDLNFAGIHLFYVTKGGYINNLYYFGGCPPKQLRQETNEDVVATVNSSGTIYPNPFTDQVNINLTGSGEAAIELLDVTGKIILSQAYGFGPAQVNTTSLNKGVYICKVVQNGQTLFREKLQK